MATYLSIVNKVLGRFNEVALTSANFNATSTNFQGTVKNYVNDTLRDIYNAEREWPFLITADNPQTLTAGTQVYSLPTGNVSVDWESFYVASVDKITNGSFTSAITGWTSISTGTGTASYTATDNGRLRLNGGASGVGAAEQSISTISGHVYRLIVRIFGGTLALKVGTSSGASDILSETFTFTATGGGQFFEKTFTATGATTYIGFSHADNADYDVDYVSCFRNVRPQYMTNISYDRWRQEFRDRDYQASPSQYNVPRWVFARQDQRFGVSQIPDDDYVVFYDYWTVPDDLSDYLDEPAIPEKYIHVLLDGCMYYAYLFRDNMEEAAIARDKFKKGINLMRTDLINKDTHMRSDYAGYHRR